MHNCKRQGKVKAFLMEARATITNKTAMPSCMEASSYAASARCMHATHACTYTYIYIYMYIYRETPSLLAAFRSSARIRTAFDYIVIVGAAVISVPYITVVVTSYIMLVVRFAAAEAIWLLITMIEGLMIGLRPAGVTHCVCRDPYIISLSIYIYMYVCMYIYIYIYIYVYVHI